MIQDALEPQPIRLAHRRRPAPRWGVYDVRGAMLTITNTVGRTWTDLPSAAWDCSVLGPDESRAALWSAP